MGRNEKPEGGRAQTISFRGSAEEKMAIKALAGKMGVDVADLARDAIMDKHGSKITELVRALGSVVP